MTTNVVKMVPKTSFTETEAAELTRLLGLVAKDKGSWPTQECFLAADRATPRWAAEVVITNPSWEEWENNLHLTEPPKVLLIMYGTEGGKGTFKPHWTLPGSRGQLKESIADTVWRVGKKEIGGVEVDYLDQILMDHKWIPGEHPDGAQVLSLYVKCRARGVVETENRKFWPLNKLPELDNPNGIHCRNLRKCFGGVVAAKLLPTHTVDP